MTQSIASEAADADMPRVLERGDIFILCPPINGGDLGSMPDDDRFYLLLHPHSAQNHRLIEINRSCHAETTAGENGESASLDSVSSCNVSLDKACFRGQIEEVIRTDRFLQERFAQPDYGTHRHGNRFLLSLRMAGMGDYTLMQQGDDTRLSYSLVQPLSHCDIGAKLDIAPVATYQIRVKQPDNAAAPEMAGESKATSTGERLRQLANCKFISADTPQLLDHEGVEILLMGVEPQEELPKLM